MVIKRYICLVVIVIGLIALVGCKKSDNSKSESGNNNIDTVVDIKVDKPDYRLLEQTITTTGTALADEDVEIKTKLAGTIDKVYVEEGDYVKAGDPLADIEIEKWQLIVSQAEAGVAQAKAAFENAKIDLERKKKLYEKNAISEGMFDRIKTQYESMDAAYKVAQVQYKQAQMSLNDSRITSPLSGYVKYKSYEAGEYVDTMRSSSMFAIMKIDPIRIRFSLPEKYYDNISKHTKFEVTFSAMPNKSYTGTISIISPSVDQMTRTISLEGKIDNRDRLIKPGSFAEIKIALTENGKSLVIPATALISEGGQKFVYLVEDGKSVKTLIDIGITTGGYVEVLDGLTIDSQVVVEGLATLHDGSKVKIVN